MTDRIVAMIDGHILQVARQQISTKIKSMSLALAS